MAQPSFMIFPSTTAIYTWRIVGMESGRTISRHKLLAEALRKCEQLNLRSAGTDEGIHLVSTTISNQEAH